MTNFTIKNTKWLPVGHFFFFFFFLITRATNKKILVSAFLGKSFQQILFGKYTQQSQPMTWLTFGANNFKLVFER